MGFACLALIALGAVSVYVRRDHEPYPRHAEESEQALQGLQASHVEAHLPSGADIDRFLRRDVGEYFATARGKTMPLELEWLREGPTQSGVSFPKLYLWVRLGDGVSPDDRGAVRIVAVERDRFVVTDFLSERVIRADLQTIYRVFPKLVCERINKKLAS